MRSQIPVAIRVLLAFTVLTGLIYPAFVTALSQVCFRHQANGSLIIRGGQVVGSELIGQNFTRPEYFHPRPSDAGAEGYDASSSGASNLGPTSRRLFLRVRAAIESFRIENPDFNGPIPADLLTSSGSGLDPHLSPASAAAQVSRVAKARGVTQDQIRSIVSEFTQNPDLGLLGERRVNILRTNIALDERFPLTQP